MSDVLILTLPGYSELLSDPFLRSSGHQQGQGKESKLHQEIGAVAFPKRLIQTLSSYFLQKAQNSDGSPVPFLCCVNQRPCFSNEH